MASWWSSVAVVAPEARCLCWLVLLFSSLSWVQLFSSVFYVASCLYRRPLTRVSRAVMNPPPPLVNVLL